MSKPSASPLRRFADAMSRRIAKPDEDPGAWAEIRQAIADHLEDYVRGEALKRVLSKYISDVDLAEQARAEVASAGVSPEIALLLASSLRQVQHKELPTLWTPMPKRRGESPDTSGVHACRATAVEYILFCRANAGFDRASMSTVATSFGCHERTVKAWLAKRKSEVGPVVPVGYTADQAFELYKTGLATAARHYIKYGGASGTAISKRRRKG